MLTEQQAVVGAKLRDTDTEYLTFGLCPFCEHLECRLPVCRMLQFLLLLFLALIGEGLPSDGTFAQCCPVFASHSRARMQDTPCRHQQS